MKKELKNNRFYEKYILGIVIAIPVGLFVNMLSSDDLFSKAPKQSFLFILALFTFFYFLNTIERKRSINLKSYKKNKLLDENEIKLYSTLDFIKVFSTITIFYLSIMFFFSEDFNKLYNQEIVFILPLYIIFGLFLFFIIIYTMYFSSTACVEEEKRTQFLIISIFLFIVILFFQYYTISYLFNFENNYKSLLIIIFPFIIFMISLTYVVMILENHVIKPALLEIINGGTKTAINMKIGNIDDALKYKEVKDGLNI